MIDQLQGSVRHSSEPLAERLWAEHGWGLTGQQVGIILAIIFTVSAVLRLIS